VLFALVFVLALPLVGMLYVDTMVVKREASKWKKLKSFESRLKKLKRRKRND